ncbi:MAG TPA: FecR family protein, partial [Polyangia bacterium]|nr:FecR family protein [Polyangia bacterium]
PGPLADDVARALSRRPRLKLRPAWKWAPALALGMTAAAFVVIPMVRPQPLGYELSGTYAARDDGFETPGNGTATARFSDGTSVAVGAGSAARVRARTRTGATIRLERGRASFAVVHRPGARWNVEVGPFEIAVTGTEFDVHWSDDRDGFEVVMKSGTVVVSGSLTGEGIPLHAGQRLVASLTNKTLVVNEVVRAQRPQDAAATARVVAPHDEAPPPPRRARLVAQAEPELTLRDVGPPSESPEVLARRRALNPPPFEPAPPQPPTAAPAAPAAPTAAELGMGGGSCNARPLPQIRFEHATEGFRVLSGDSASVFRNPVIDHDHSWCGGGSLRFETAFDIDPSAQSGEAVVFLPHNVDLRGKTVSVRFMIQGTGDAEFTARILAGQGDRRTGNTYTPQLTAGRWWTISTTFHDQLTGFGNFESNIHMADRIILKVDATGTFRVWSGSIFIDDIGWR